MNAPGVPVIRSVNWGGLRTLYIKEVRRFFKVQLQTVWAPAITTLLFLVVFTIATGAKRPVLVGGVEIPHGRTPPSGVEPPMARPGSRSASALGAVVGIGEEDIEFLDVYIQIGIGIRCVS